MAERILAGMLTAIHQQCRRWQPNQRFNDSTIDILLEVESLAALDGLNDKMHDMRSTLRGENGITGRRYYIKGNGDRTHHVHAFTAGSEQAIRHLTFRDYLRKHHGIRGNQATGSRRQPAKPGGLWPVEKRIYSRHEQLARHG